MSAVRIQKGGACVRGAVYSVGGSACETKWGGVVRILLHVKGSGLEFVPGDESFLSPTY